MRRATLAPHLTATSICRRRCETAERCRRASKTRGWGTRCRLRSGEPLASSTSGVLATVVRALEVRAGEYLGHHRDHRRVPPRLDAPCLRRITLASAGASISNFSAKALSGPRRSADAFRLFPGTCLDPSDCNRSSKGRAPAFPRVIVGPKSALVPFVGGLRAVLLYDSAPLFGGHRAAITLCATLLQ
jgi:hypothetical protein